MKHSSVKYPWCLAIVLATFLCTASGYAQTVSAKPKAAADTAKTVKFTVAFGPYKKDMKPLVADFKRVLNADLKVTDQQGTAWTVVSYRLGWRRREFSDDARTGKRKIVYLYNGKDVNNASKIPADWQAEMNEFLQATEEILFEEIIVQHPKTKKMMMAPTLSFKTI
jgi:hypothetical protein